MLLLGLCPLSGCPQGVPGALAAAGLTQPGSMGAFPWIYRVGQMRYANPVNAGSGNKTIPVNTSAGGSERPVAPGCSSSPGSLTHQDGTSWKWLGKACQSQSPDGIFVLPGKRRGEGSERGWGHGRSVRCAANPALCQRLWELIQLGLPLSVPPSQAQGSPGTAAGTQLSWANTGMSRIIFPTFSF